MGALIEKDKSSVPLIVYNPYFNEDPLFNINIDPQVTARLCRFIGMTDEEMVKKTINVSPEIPLNGNLGTYLSSTQIVTLYPGAVWAHYQELVLKTQLATTGKGVRREVRSLSPDIFVNKETRKEVSGGQKQKMAEQAQQYLSILFSRKQGNNFMEAVGDNDFDAVSNLLKPKAEAYLRYILGHELQHAKENPSEFQVAIYRSFLPKFVGFLLAAQMVLLMESNGLDDGSIYGSLIAASFAGFTYTVMKQGGQQIGGWLNPYEKRARACGESVAEDLQWASLITVRGQWSF